MDEQERCFGLVTPRFYSFWDWMRWHYYVEYLGIPLMYPRIFDFSWEDSVNWTRDE